MSRELLALLAGAALALLRAQRPYVPGAQLQPWRAEGREVAPYSDQPAGRRLVDVGGHDASGEGLL